MRKNRKRDAIIKDTLLVLTRQHCIKPTKLMWKVNTNYRLQQEINNWLLSEGYMETVKEGLRITRKGLEKLSEEQKK